MFKPKPIDRRDALKKIGGGFAFLSFASMIGESLAQAEVTAGAMPWMSNDPKFKPKAKHVIFLFMNGGVYYFREGMNRVEERFKSFEDFFDSVVAAI